MSKQISKYLDAFPSSHFYITKDEFLFYLFQEGNEKYLYRRNINQHHKEAVKVCDEDFSKQTYWPFEYNEKESLLYFISDTDNLENYNIYTIDCKTRSITQITHNEYTQMYALNSTKDLLLYSDRKHHTSIGYDSDVYLLDLSSMTKKLLMTTTDEDHYKVTWSGASFSHDNKKVIFRVDYQSKRLKSNFLEVDINTGKKKLLLPSNLESATLHLLGNRHQKYLYFICEVNQQKNIYRFDCENSKIKQLSNFKENIHQFIAEKDISKSNNVLGLIKNKEDDQVSIRKYSLVNDSLKLNSENTLKGNFDFFDYQNNIWLNHDSFDTPRTLVQLKEDLKLTEFKINLGKENIEDISRCRYEFHQYETFDGNKVDSYFILPKGEVKAVLVTAFYGGNNFYHFIYNLFAEYGIATFSPSVRGSMNVNPAWRKLIYGDLGGDEILDVIWAARYVRDTLSIPEHKIGISGGSHGGYATLRAITMPEKFKGFDTRFNFGAAICAAGFADLVDFYKTSNIPDWLVQMLGKYDEKKYLERSPISYFDNLSCPLLVLHGTNDARVSPSSMKGFIEKLKQSDKEYEIFISEGQGHHTNNKELRIIEIQKRLDFLKKHLLS